MNILKDVLLVLVSGSVGAIIVRLVGDRIAWKRDRKTQKQDRAEEQKRKNKELEAVRAEERLTAIEAKTDAQSEALKFLLYDRIRHLGRVYISDGEIDFDDRRILNDMHSSYHNGLGGNGDLDVLMRDVNALPLKVQKQ